MEVKTRGLEHILECFPTCLISESTSFCSPTNSDGFTSPSVTSEDDEGLVSPWSLGVGLFSSVPADLKKNDQVDVKHQCSFCSWLVLLHVLTCHKTRPSLHFGQMTG